MKHLVFFLLLALGSPFWLLLRSHLGSRLFAMLGLSSAFIFAAAFFRKELPLPAALAPYINHDFVTLYAVPIILFWLQFLTRFFGIFDFTNNNRSTPWSIGRFRLWSFQPILTDLALVALFIWLAYEGLFTLYPHDLIATAITAFAATTYLIVVLVGHLNHGTLPFKASPAKQRPPKVAKPPKPYLTDMRRMPKPAREDLSAIFSRRDPALAKINGGKST